MRHFKAGLGPPPPHLLLIIITIPNTEEAGDRTKQNNKTNKQTTLVAIVFEGDGVEGVLSGRRGSLDFQFYSVPSTQSLHFTFDIKKELHETRQNNL